MSNVTTSNSLPCDKRDGEAAVGGTRPRFWPDLNLARDAIVLMVSNGLAGFFFLLVHMVAGRWLPPREYAVFVALLGLLWIILVPSSALQVAVARYAAEYAHAQEHELWARLFRTILRWVTLGGGTLWLVWWLAAPWLDERLGHPGVGAVRWVGAIAWLSLYTPVVTGVLQGAHRFGWIALAALAPGVVRLILAVPCSLYGQNAAAMLGAYAGSVAAGLLVGLWPVRHAWRTSGTVSLRPFVGYFLPVAVGQLVLYALMNADLILSPRLLRGPVFESYGKAAMLARTVLFLPMPLVLAMFPRAVVSNRRRMLLQPLAMGTFLSVVLAGVLTAIPHWALRAMYGVESAAMVRLLRYYAWAAVPLGTTQLLGQYLWARRDTAGVVLLAPLVGLYVVLAARWAVGNAPALIAGLGVTSLAACALLVGRVMRRWQVSNT